MSLPVFKSSYQQNVLSNNIDTSPSDNLNQANGAENGAETNVNNETYEHDGVVSNSNQCYPLDIVMYPLNRGFRYELVDNSLPEVHGTVPLPDGDVSCLRMMMSFIGPGLLY